MSALVATAPARLRARRRARLAALLRETASRVTRWALITLGGVIMLAGAILTPLPGHVGLPLLVIGLMVVLRNSIQARRRFIRLQRRHPKMVFPIRRLLRREPEVVLVVWQQLLRTERLVVRRASWRVFVRGRKHLRGRWRRARGHVAKA